MVTNYQDYKASLKGMNSIEFYIIKLRTYSGSKIIVENEGDCIRFQSIDPKATVNVIKGIKTYMSSHDVKSLKDLTGTVKWQKTPLSH